MKYIKNEKGITLVEVLAAIVILSIVLGSVMNFFPQIATVNKVNEDKSKAISLAKQELIKWQTDGKAFLKSGTVPTNVDNLSVSSDAYFHLQSKQFEPFTEDIFITKMADTPAGTNPNPTTHSVSQANLIKIQLSDKKGTVITQTYGYIFSE